MWVLSLTLTVLCELKGYMCASPHRSSLGISHLSNGEKTCAMNEDGGYNRSHSHWMLKIRQTPYVDLVIKCGFSITLWVWHCYDSHLTDEETRGGKRDWETCLKTHSEEWSQGSNPGSLILESAVLTTFITNTEMILLYTIYFMLYTISESLVRGCNSG